MVSWDWLLLSGLAPFGFVSSARVSSGFVPFVFRPLVSFCAGGFSLEFPLIHPLMRNHLSRSSLGVHPLHSDSSFHLSPQVEYLLSTGAMLAYIRCLFSPHIASRSHQRRPWEVVGICSTGRAGHDSSVYIPQLRTLPGTSTRSDSIACSHSVRQACLRYNLSLISLIVNQGSEAFLSLLVRTALASYLVAKPTHTKTHPETEIHPPTGG